MQRHNEKKAAKKKRRKEAPVQPLKVGPTKLKDSTKRKPVGDSFKVVVSNLKKSVTDDELRQAFSTCGDIKSLKIARDKFRVSDCKGYCHIEFTAHTGMDAALAANLKTRVQGQLVTVRLPGASQSEVPRIDIKAAAKGVPIKVIRPADKLNREDKETKRKREEV